MKRIMPITLLVLVVALATPNLCLSDDGQTLNPEVKVRLEKLKENEDLTGIVRLWEEAGKTCPSRVKPTFAQALLSFPREKFVPVLLEGMSSRNGNVAGRCCWVLVALKERRAVQLVVEKVIPPLLSEEQRKKVHELADDLGDEDYEKRKAARKELISMGPTIRKFLKPFTESPDMEVAVAASEILKVPSFEVSIHDVNLLRGFRDKEALPALRVIVKNQGFDAAVVRTAIWALGEFGSSGDAEIIRPYLNSRSEAFVASALYALVKLKDVTILPVLIRHLEEGRPRVARALGNLGDKRAIDPLVKALNTSEGFRGKLHFACALAQIGEKKYLHELLSNASRGDIEGTFGAEGFQEYPLGPEEAKFLIRHVKGIRTSSGTDHSIICCFVRMAKCGDKEAIDTVRQARKKVSADGGLTWTEGSFYSSNLISLGDAEEEKKILNLAKDKDPEKRYKALNILAYANSEKYLPLFLAALDDKARFRHPLYLGNEQVEVRRAAILGIERISEEPFHLWSFDRDRQVREIKAWWEKYQEEKAAQGE